MLQVARLSPRLLGDAADLTANFFLSRLNPDGGFQNREGASDLYYTVFGLEGLLALQREFSFNATREYLQSFGLGHHLDFVHTACLARCWASIGCPEEAPAQAILQRLEACRTPDGGYSPAPGASHGTAYGCFLALGAYQDLGAPLPGEDGLIRCLKALRAADGGFANQPGAAEGLTPPTAAAVTLMRHLSKTKAEKTGSWLLARHVPGGGFFASPGAPIPDLLSTATALHALAGLDAPVEPVRDACIDFIDSLWSKQGGFYGHWNDDVQDCEYTYYALLALGHLSL